MEYSIHQLSVMAGVSTRTLRYYDQIGLLKPSRLNESGCRSYGTTEADRLQQILFYRERGMGLKQIAVILDKEDFDRMEALEEHLASLEQEKRRLDALIKAVRQTIKSIKGEIKMSDEEKFNAFKQKAVEENEEKYGCEIREKYGEESVEASNSMLLNMSGEEYEGFQKLGEEILASLRKAVLEGVKPDSGEGHRIAELHRDWLCHTWPRYTKEAHDGIVDMYLADERFTAYYDSEVKGCAQFLADAVHAV